MKQKRLNPRFDGAFLNCIKNIRPAIFRGLNPRFDGAFLNFYLFALLVRRSMCLNPRFDGAFLNSK